VVALLLAIALSLPVGWWRGPFAGIATGFGVLAAVALGHVVVLSLSLPM
jgi:hypothetical protein